ncbi:MAG: helix-turn-helix domain-containing protein [Desulfosudis oleivorans]|nr:helix-turn-helix domain-containing protein [Desulfosudis oleivorans]
MNAAAALLDEDSDMDNDKTYARENALERCVSDCEKTVIIHALRRTKGNTSDAAQILGTTKRVLAGKIHKYEIDCTQFESE